MSLLNQPSTGTEALVLRTWACGETSVIASILTRDHGFVKVLAKAARRPRSQLRPLVEPGRLVNLEFSLNPGRDLQFLRGGSVLLDPLGAQATLESTAFLQAALELIDRSRPVVSVEEDQDSGVLFAVCEAFVRVLSCPSCLAPAMLFFALEWELLALHGMAPELGACTSCGQSNTETWWFSPADGGVVCGACAQAGRAVDAQPLARGTFKSLQALAQYGVACDVSEPDDRPLRRDLGTVLHRFLGYHLPGYRLPAALDLLRPVGGQPPAKE